MSESSRNRVVRIMKILLAYREMAAKDLANRAGISPGSLSDRMHGRSKITLDDLEMWAKALDVSGAVWFSEPEDVLMSVVANEDSPRRRSSDRGPKNRCSSDSDATLVAA